MSTQTQRWISTQIQNSKWELKCYIFNKKCHILSCLNRLCGELRPSKVSKVKSVISPSTSSSWTIVTTPWKCTARSYIARCATCSRLKGSLSLYKMIGGRNLWQPEYGVFLKSALFANWVGTIVRLSQAHPARVEHRAWREELSRSREIHLNYEYLLAVYLVGNSLGGGY